MYRQTLYLDIAYFPQYQNIKHRVQALLLNYHPIIQFFVDEKKIANSHIDIISKREDQQRLY